LETLVAGTLLVLTALALFKLMSSAWLAFAVGEQKLTAGALAQSLLEEHRSGDFDALASAQLAPVTINRTEYSRKVEVTPRGPLLKDVRTVIGWDSRRGKGQLVRRSTLCKVPR